MEATLVVKVQDLTTEYVNGISKIFPKDATLNITVNYDLQSANTASATGKAAASPGKKRGPKPKTTETQAEMPAPKKRGRKPKVPAE